MEQCLYRHRRNWERSVEPEPFDMVSEVRKTESSQFGPWTYHWNPNPYEEYIRPDPFDPRHICAESEDDPKIPDEYDRTIDYGQRRDRLRKHFEWEMDRLYLVEETESRRQARREREQAQHTTATDVAPRKAVACECNINRLEWSHFKRSTRLLAKDECVIDVLVGDPVLDNEIPGFQRWFGYTGPGVRKVAKSQDTNAFDAMAPGQAPLPERIRIYSLIIITILSKILGSDGSSLVAGAPIVFIRPFKALIYCERALRDWHMALQRKFDSAAKIEVYNTMRVNEYEKEKVNDDEKKEDEDPDDITKSPIALQHLSCLLSLMDSDISPKQRHIAAPNYRKVFFSDLWHIFRPGVEVIGHDGKQAYRVIKAMSAKHRVEKPPFSVICVYIDFDGKSLGPVTQVFDLKRFEGERELTSLEIYPLRCHPLRKSDFTENEWKEVDSLPSHDKYRRKLIRRGAKFLEVAGVKHMYYAGPTLVVRDEVESPVVIDFETAFSVEDRERQQWQPRLEMLIGESSSEIEDKQPGCTGVCCENESVHDDIYVDEKQRTEYIDSLLPKGNVMDEPPSVAIIPRLLGEVNTGIDGAPVISDDELLIMSYRVFGFVLRSRKWANLDLAYLTDIHPLQNSPSLTGDPKQGDYKKAEPVTAFDQLVLEEGHKPMIVSLIAQHFRDKKLASDEGEQFDIVKGKGKGLILLLHGAPGVGKTSTAEGVAELFKKPLFQITCGDLGTTATEVEKALETNFALANRWDCILLLDEADVFLAERTKEDFKRNGLVAVFLRVMEYYAGILFLTTNRVGDFDEAFASRIHISLYYPDLNHDKTVEVFKINMDMIEERFNRRGRKIDIDKVGIGNFAGQHFLEYPHARWNGRQVRNACQTALALAEFEAQGNSHEAILNPDAIVKLSVDHFRIVRNAYLEFTKYINDLYGTNAARRAKEARRRAIWMSDDDTDMGGSAADRRRAFFMASQGQKPTALHQPQAQVNMHQQYPEYVNVAVPQPSYPDRSQVPTPLFYSVQNRGSPNIPAAGAPGSHFQMSTEERNQMLPHRQPAGQSVQQPPQPFDPGLNQSMQGLYTAGGQQSMGQMQTPSISPGISGSYASVNTVPRQQWTRNTGSNDS
ncbi:hypothetical protein P168DRAFT_254563 [Aspergillus campestris IBT 28561]|uniref:AAA+ ATPase domain-containing protein n=1 Tax=Aspergillus campestris (strain IBT 28561) TaxID=1392248 RepID=A0A2I1D1U7_ASPC2|nr:uncharacterized protein P168DRAFT_254563 [Aspergillus campestris IBT 28561]PKY03828.1 hypothetical protein P168DRAFT_254563 [Aspergillus campestris IBT 28561]